MTHLDLIADQDILGLGKPDRVVKTVLSHVFFFGDTVIKALIPQEAISGDFRMQANRRRHMEEEFRWNQVFSPEVHEELLSIETEEGVEYLIKMKKIDAENTLIPAITAGHVSEEQVEQLTRQLVKALDQLHEELQHEWQDLLGTSWNTLFFSGLDDLNTWMEMAKDHPAFEEAHRYLSTVRAHAMKHPYFQNEALWNKRLSVDTNSDNILFLNGKFVFLDFYPPKYEWRVMDHVLAFARVAADCAVLGSPEMRERVYAVFGEHFPLPPKDVVLYYELWGALIQWTYRHFLGQGALSDKYLKYSSHLIAQLSV